MLKTLQLTKFIANNNPQLNPARLTFFNYLRHYSAISEILTPQALNDFFMWALDFPHWQQNKVALGKEVQAVLNNFSRECNQFIDTREVIFPNNVQIIELESFQDITEVISAYVSRKKADATKFKIVSDQSKRAVVIELLDNKNIRVSTYDKKFVIRNGLLEPLRTLLSVTYNEHLELLENCVHTLEVAPYITAQFKMIGAQAVGSLIRGYMFQRYVEVNGETLAAQPKLFFPVKRLEQFFVDRNTDIYYTETTQMIERAQQLLQNNDPGGPRWAQIALNRAEMALENVYIGDKLLGLMIRDLKHSFKPEQVVNLDPSLLSNPALSPKNEILN